MLEACRKADGVGVGACDVSFQLFFSFVRDEIIAVLE